MKNNKLILLGVFILIALITMVAGTSYAYYLKKIKGGDNTRVIMKSANMLLRYEESNEVIGRDITPGWEETLNFSIENYSSDTDGKYKISLVIESPLTDEIENDFVYSLVGESSNKNEKLFSKNETPVPVETTDLGVNEIMVGSLHSYKLNIKLKDNNENQNYLMGKKFVAKIKVELVYD